MRKNFWNQVWKRVSLILVFCISTPLNAGVFELQCTSSEKRNRSLQVRVKLQAMLSEKEGRELLQADVSHLLSMVHSYCFAEDCQEPQEHSYSVETYSKEQDVSKDYAGFRSYRLYYQSSPRKEDLSLLLPPISFLERVVRIRKDFKTYLVGKIDSEVYNTWGELTCRVIRKTL